MSDPPSFLHAVTLLSVTCITGGDLYIPNSDDLALAT